MALLPSRSKHRMTTEEKSHKNIQHTVRYTELAPHRFKDFWR
jgi:hypothetical protein